MKKIAGLFALVSAFVIALTTILSSATLAEGIMPLAIPQPTGKFGGSITLTAPAGETISGRRFRVYRLLDATINADGTEVAYRIYSNDVREELRDYFGCSPTDPDTVLIQTIKSLEDNDDDFQQFAKDMLETVIDSDDVEYVDGTVPSGSNTLTISNLKYGYYLIEDTTIPGSNIVVSALALTTTNPDPTITLKMGRPTIDKYFTSESGDTKDPNSKSIGDKIDYKIVATVPDTTGYTDYTYVITDTLSKGLTPPTASDVTVQLMDSNGSNPTTLSSPGHYTFGTASVTGGNGTRLTFTFHKIRDYTKGQKIVITYRATLNNDAVIGSTGNTNTVSLTYSNYPADYSETTKTPDETLVTFTFNMEITKTVGGHPDYTLAGAKFRLYRTTTGDAKEYLQLGNDGKVTGWTSQEADASTIVTGEGGKFRIIGLETGHYYLEETEAPAGYNPLTKPIEITITATYSADGKTVTGLSATVDENTVSGEENNSLISITVENNGGPPLPGTGGAGRKAIYILGASLALGSVILLVTKKRMQDANL